MRPALIAFLVSSLAHAATGPKLILLPAAVDAPSKQQEAWLTEQAELAMNASGRFTVLPLGNVGNVLAEAQPAKAAEAEALMKAAHKSLDDLDAEKAITEFTNAIALWRQADLTDPAVFDQLITAWVMRAASQVANGDTAAAKTEIEKILTVSTKAVFPDAFFPPDLLKFVEAQKKTVSRATGELNVRTDPPAAKVWVDGVARPVSPAKTTNLAGGKHLVVVSLPGFEHVVADMNLGDELVKLKPNEGAAKLKAAQDKVVKGPDGAPRDAAGKEWAQLTNQADQALILVAKKSTAGQKLELTAVRLEVRDGHNAGYRTGTVAMGDSAALQTFLQPVLAKDVPREGGKPVKNFGGGSGGSGGGGAVRTVTGVGLIVLGLASAGVGAYAGVSASGKAAEYRNTPQVFTAKSENLKTEGKNFALVADITLIAGAVLAATGAVVLITGAVGSSAASPDPAKNPGVASTRVNEPAKVDAAKVDTAKQADDAKKADDARKADEAKKAGDAKKAEDAAKAEEAKKADDAKKVEDAKKAEAAAKSNDPKVRKAEEKRKAEEAKKAAKDAKAAEEKKKADDAKAAKDAKAAEEKKKADEAKAAKDAKAAEEKKKADDGKAEAQKKADDGKAAKEAKAAEDAKKTEDAKAEAQKKADEAKAAEDAKKNGGKKADEEAKKVEEAKKAEEEARKAEEAKKAEEEAKRAEAKRKAEEEKKADEARKKAEQEKKKKVDEDDLRNY